MHTTLEHEPKKNLNRHALFRDFKKVFLGPALIIGLQMIIAGLLSWTALYEALVLILGVHILTYLYVGGTVLETRTRIENSILIFVLHLGVILTEYWLLLNYDPCVLLRSVFTSFLSILGAKNIETSHHYGHSFNFRSFTKIDLFKFFLKNVELFITSYVLVGFYKKDPLKRSNYSYRTNYLSLLKIVLGGLLIGDSLPFSDAIFYVFPYGLLIIVFYSVVEYFFRKSKQNNNENIEESWTNTERIYTPKKDEKDLYDGKQDKENFVYYVRRATFFIFLSRALNWGIVFHTLCTSRCTHEIAYKLSLYVVYEELVQLVSALLLVLKTESMRSLISSITCVSFYTKNMKNLVLMYFLHLIEHSVPMILSNSVSVFLVFTVVKEFQRFSRLVLTQNEVLE